MTVSVELCLRGDFDPRDITERIGITPSKSSLKGSKNQLLNLPVFSGWTIASRTVPLDVVSGNEIISELLSTISSKVEILKSVLNDFKADVGIIFLIRNYSSDDLVGWGLEMSIELLKFSTDIGASIEIVSCNIVKSEETQSNRN